MSKLNWIIPASDQDPSILLLLCFIVIWSYVFHLNFVMSRNSKRSFSWWPLFIAVCEAAILVGVTPR
jgi:hypothetical protein